MSVLRLSQSSLSTRGRGKGSTFIAGYGFGVDEMDLIARTTVGAGGAASVVFSSIPQTYQHLQIRWISRTTASANNRIRFRFNGDTGANYSAHLIYGSGSSALAASGASLTQGGSTALSNNTGLANVFVAGIDDILDYTSTSKTKVMRQLSGVDDNSGGEVVLASGLWNNTSAITSVTLFWDSGNLAQNSVVSLYGVVG